MADVITRLKLESNEFDSKIKRAAQGLLQMEQEFRKVGGTLAVLEKDQLEFVKGLGKMETVSKNVRGKIGELTSAYTELSIQYKHLTDEEKKGDYGKALSASLAQLKTRINDAKTELNDVSKELNFSGGKFGEFGNVIDTLGQKMGVSGNLTDMLTSKTALLTGAIGASVAIVGKATEGWVKYNEQLAKQDQITTFTTGLKGDEADKMTDMARALVDTYNVDFRQAINAANTLMSQFGTTSSETMQLLRDGMQGMINGDGGKLLSMIQQYAPAFRDAGVSASQLVAVIQNSEGGIFTDQNMNAIVMGIKNIRLMTNATSEALAKLGIDGEEMTRKLNDGSISVFDALKKVAQAVEGTSSSSQSAGEVMQQVFGRQGAMAGTKLGEAISSLNLDLEETKRQTGEVGEAYSELEKANERLNKAIRDCFEYDGWEKMAAGIKSTLIDALSSVLELTVKIKDSWVIDVGSTIFDFIGDKALQSLGPLGKVYTAISAIKALASGGSDENAAGAGASIGGVITATRKSSGFLGDDALGTHPGLIVKSTTPQNTGNEKGSRHVNTEPTYQEGSIAAQAAEVSKLQKLWKETAESVRDQYLPALVEAENRLKDMQNAADLQKENANGRLLPVDVQMPTGDELINSLIPSMESLQQKLDENPIRINIENPTKDIKAITKAAYVTADVVGSIGDAFNAIEDPAAKVAGTVAQAIATVALGYAQATMMAAETSGPWAWIAFAATGLATMLSTIASIHSATGYANGGIVGGNSFSGDNIYAGPDAMVNSGELILNKAQQNVIAQDLQGGSKMIQVRGVLHGKDIFIAAENWSKSVGKGELVTW